MAPFVNIFLLKHLTRAVSCLALTARWLWRRRKRPRTLLLYGVTSAHLLPALLAARLFGARIAAIATDLPSSPPIREGMLRHTVRRLDRALILAALRRLDGLIVLSPHLAADLAPGVPALLMEGIVPPAVADRPAVPAPPTDPAMRRAPGVCTLMYAGALLESYGIGALLDAFAHLEGPGWRLWITGKGEMGDAVRAAAARDPRIIYWGFVATDTVAALLREADILVNPRPSDPLARYCFQSKLIEYMASGRPSVVHRVPSIPDEYTPYLVFPEAETVEGLAAAIRALRAEGEVALTARGAAARRFVLEHKDYRRQGARMWAFLRDLGCKWPTMEPRPMSNPPG